MPFDHKSYVEERDHMAKMCVIMSGYLPEELEAREQLRRHSFEDKYIGRGFCCRCGVLSSASSFVGCVVVALPREEVMRRKESAIVSMMGSRLRLRITRLGEQRPEFPLASVRGNLSPIGRCSWDTVGGICAVFPDKRRRA